jgi:hypothetical protein
MATEFELILEDFEAELVAIEGMIASLSSTGSSSPARARVAGANAATLLLAATFEEYVRQEVKATFNARAANVSDMKDFPPKIAGVVWRRSLERLSREPLEDLVRDPSGLDDRLKATVGFCIQKDLQADVSDAVAHNDNNMRPGELNRLFNQLGLKDMCAKAASHAPLTKFLGCDSAGKANAALQARLEDFFVRRNTIAHAIQLNSSSGAPALTSDIEFFRELARALASASAQYCGVKLGQSGGKHSTKPAARSRGIAGIAKSIKAAIVKIARRPGIKRK